MLIFNHVVVVLFGCDNAMLTMCYSCKILSGFIREVAKSRIASIHEYAMMFTHLCGYKNVLRIKSFRNY